MIFVGDIASPNPETSNCLVESVRVNQEIFENNFTIGNLEGMIYDGEIYDQGSVLYNHPSLSDAFHLMNVKGLSLSNNHTLDLPDQFEVTREYLDSRNIAFFGAGKNFNKAGEPATIEWGNKEYIIYGYTWDVLLHHQKNSSDNLCVNTLEPAKVFNDVKTTRNKNPEAVIVLLMHWSFDLEVLPFPMYRELSKKLIDVGADAVIGTHSHCIQGGERYKNGIIVYGLGNFYMPWGFFVDGKLKFPDFAKDELIVEWNAETGEACSHFFRYDEAGGNHKIKWIASENFDDGSLINKYSPYRDMSHSEYLKWFKNNRRKDFLIPIHRSHTEVIRNQFIDYYLKKEFNLLENWLT